jgi:Family of unknown function (DUF6152)
VPPTPLRKRGNARNKGQIHLRLKFPALAAAAALASASAFAHHSFAMFDDQKIQVVKGTLLKFTYLNPHTWISVVGTVDDASVAERWDIEATSPAQLAHIGIHADTFKAGDKLTVAFHPLRDGRRGGTLVFLITSDGTSHGAKPKEVGLDSAKLKP